MNNKLYSKLLFYKIIKGFDKDKPEKLLKVLGLQPSGMPLGP